MRGLLIDDLRTLPVDKIVRTYKEGIKALTNFSWDIVFLDHDLGTEKKTGYDILCWLEENKQFIPKEIIVVSSNPSGVKRMRQV